MPLVQWVLAASISIVREDEKQRCAYVPFPRLFFFTLKLFRAFVYHLRIMSKSLSRPRTWSSRLTALPTGTCHRLERTDPQIIDCDNPKILPEADELCGRRSKVFRSGSSFDPSLFSSPPRPAPLPPQRPVTKDIKLCIAGKSFEFPSPPLGKDSNVSLTRSPATRAVYRKRTHSPASSISSAASSSSSDDTVGQPPLTPSTSDDEHILTSLSVTAPNSKRLSVLFVKSMPDLRPANLKNTASEEISEEDGEEAEWLTQEMQDFVTLSSPPVSDESLSSRPESFLPPFHLSNPALKELSSVIGPSAQLDPTFHFCQKKTRSFVVPSRPPPPPPIQICPASPLNNVFAVSSPPLSTAAIPPTPISSRPPPRSSIPADVDELMQMDMDDFDFLELTEARDSCTDSPFNSILNAYQHSPVTSFGFGVDDLPTTPSSFAFSDDSHHYDLPRSPLYRSSSLISTASSSTRRLRSKWSTSTLGSVYNNQTQPSSWMSKFSFKKGSSKEKAVPSTPTLPSSPGSAKKEKRRKFTGTDVIVRCSYESDVAQVGRRDSRGSRNSSESVESSPSPGLRRKPIPVEIFMKQ